jgi:hypothetical protein
MTAPTTKPMTRSEWLPTVEPQPPGVYPGVPFEKYFAWSNCSKHMLDAVARSPAHLRAALEQPRKRTPAMTFGAAVHAAVLEPAEFPSRYRQKPQIMDKRTKAGKAAYEAAEAAGLTLLKEEEWVAILAVRDAIRTHPFASILLAPEDGEAEVSISWVDEETGVPCRARPDFLNHAHNVVVDLKTAQDASMGVFARACANYTYHLQAAFYLDGMAAVKRPHDKFIFVGAEPEPPWAVACYELAEEDLRIGRVRYRHALAIYQQCLATNHWPGYAPEVRVIELPGWAKFVPIS